MYNVKSYKSKKYIEKAVKEAMDNKLHFPWRYGCMYYYYKNPDSLKKVTFCRNENKEMIGIAILLKFYGDTDKDENEIMIYVKKSYRRKGIGTKIIKEIISELDKDSIMYDDGDDEDSYSVIESEGVIKRKDFWKKALKD